MANPLLEKLDPDADATMRSLIGGAMRTQAVYVAAKLGIADQLSLGPRSADDLAARVQADAETLRRVLRFLVFHGVFAENEDGRFAMNRAAESLQTAHPRSLRPGAIRAGEGLWAIAGRLLSAVQTGRTPHDEIHGTTFFERHDVDGATGLASRMSSTASGLGEAIAALDSVVRARCVVDVGGAHGQLLIALLEAHPHLRGILFDRPSTIESARPVIERTGLGDRCELVAGDFFERLPAGGDVYLLSWILHDWDDEKALRILRACREAGGDAATLVIAEVLLPPRARASEWRPASGVITDPYTLDLQMLLLTGGRERTADEYRELLEKAGYEMNEVEGATSRRGVSVLEARVASR